MEMATCEGSFLGFEVFLLVFLDVFHFVSQEEYVKLRYCGSHTVGSPSGGITTFGPLIIESFGFDQLNTMLFNMPFGAIQLIATLGGAWLATRFKTKGAIIGLLCLPAIVGCVMLLEIPRGDAHKGPLLAGYYIVS
jgi:hypothetical protein